MRFGPNPWKRGEHTTATIERVVLTKWSAGRTGSTHPIAFVIFRFAHVDGRVVTQERKVVVHHGPAPGSTATIAYMPDRVAKLEYDRQSVQPPDPAVPRGWSAGIFTPADLGGVQPGDTFGMRSPMLSDKVIIEPGQDTSDIDAQRQLFVTGQRARATVTAVEPQRGLTAVKDVLITLRVGESTVQRTVRAAFWPRPGAEIEIAYDNDQVALDTDERFLSTPPSQALVFTNPPPVIEQTPPTPDLPPVQEMLDRLEAAHAAGLISDRQYKQQKKLFGRLP